MIHLVLYPSGSVYLPTFRHHLYGSSVICRLCLRPSSLIAALQLLPLLKKALVLELLQVLKVQSRHLDDLFHLTQLFF